MDIKLLEVEKIKPYKNNAKVHTREQIKKIANSIKEFGFNQPIVIDRNNIVIVGHGRLEGAKSIGMKKIPVLVANLTEKQAKAYRLADNKLNESDWDVGLVIDELKMLDNDMIDMTGFDIKEMISNKSTKIIGEVEFSTELFEENNYIVFAFDNVLDWQVIKEKLGLKQVSSMSNKKEKLSSGIGRVIKGDVLLSILND